MKKLAKISSMAAALVAAIGLVLSCAAQSTRLGGETHWLDACVSDTDCTRGQCLCGLCTQGCEGDNGCATETRNAACFQTASPGVQTLCGPGAAPRATGICLALCGTTADCPAGDMCRAGACVAALKSDAATPLPDPASFAGIDAAVDFSTPVELPPPRTTIDGATDALLGTWNEIADTGGLCALPAGCATLVFEKSPGGRGISGYVTFALIPQGPQGSPPVPRGPFATPTNPDVGYPTELSPNEYVMIQVNETSGVHYRVLDGTLAAGRLTFWYDRIDIWDSWCKLQTPRPVTVHGNAEYRCVPETADQSTSDLGKLALCRPILDGSQCAANDGFSAPCACLDGRVFRYDDWTCQTRAACACTKDECHADVQRYSFGVAPSLGVSGDTLTGNWDTSHYGLALMFRKAAL
jgi:hypothetical protein